MLISPILEGTSLEKEATRALIHQKAQGLLGQQSLFSDFKMAGEVKLNHELDTQNVAEMIRLLPLIFLFMIIFLGFYYRNLKAIFIVFFSAGLTLLGTLSVFSLISIPLNIISSIVPLLITSIALSDSLHIVNYYAHQRKKHFRELISFTWKPCLITSITTALGFFSFYPSRLITIRELALAAPMAIILAYVLIVGSNWSLLYLLRPTLETRHLPLLLLALICPF